MFRTALIIFTLPLASSAYAAAPGLSAAPSATAQRVTAEASAKAETQQQEAPAHAGAQPLNKQPVAASATEENLNQEPVRAAAGNQQEAMGASATGGNLNNTTPPVIKTFVCDPPGTPRQPIPPGKNTDDLCPPGAHLYLVLDTSSPSFRRPPTVSNIPPPLSLQHTGGVH